MITFFCPLRKHTIKGLKSICLSMPFSASSWVGGQQWSCNLLILVCWNTHCCDISPLDFFSICCMFSDTVWSPQVWRRWRASLDHPICYQLSISSCHHIQVNSSMLHLDHRWSRAKTPSKFQSWWHILVHPHPWLHQPQRFIKLLSAYCELHQLWCSMAHHLQLWALSLFLSQPFADMLRKLLCQDSTISSFLP